MEEMKNKTVDITKCCVGCAKHHTVVMKAQEFVDWQDGGFIQDVCPKMSIADREFLVSTLCPTCQEGFFD